MPHDEVLGHFLKLMHAPRGDVHEWWPAGKNQVRVLMKFQTEYVFCYNNLKDWRLETITAFCNRISGRGAKMSYDQQGNPSECHF